MMERLGSGVAELTTLHCALVAIELIKALPLS